MASIGNYMVTSKLGSGSFAVVYKGYHKVTKVPVAIKALPLVKLNAKLLQNLEMEISIMRQIDHPNVVKLYEIKKTEKYMYLVLEYCAGGDLQQYLRRQQHHGAMALTEDVARHFLFELAKGIKCLWTHNLIHRDLKPQNLLLDQDSPTASLKIADFGFARHLAAASMAETLCGSPLYMAPEILRFQKYDAKADLWSVGAILYEMVIGKPPFGGANHVQLLANIERRELQFPEAVTLSDECRHLITGLLQRAPLNRMGFVEFFCDPFVVLGEELEGGVDLVRTTTESIQEEEEETGALGTGAAVLEQTGASSHANMPLSTQHSSVKPRMDSEADSVKAYELKVPSPGRGSLLRSSRSGNIEVMQTAFGSTSGGNPAVAFNSGLRRSRIGRRTGSSGALLLTQGSAGSPRLSPQMSPEDLPTPSPRINPFKAFTESPPSVTQGGVGMRGSARTRGEESASAPTQALAVKNGGNHALDGSDEYVLVETDTPPRVVPTLLTGVAALLANPPFAPAQNTFQTKAMTAMEPSGPHGAFSHEYAQQLAEITSLRIQAIAPIAEHLWKMSCAIQPSGLSTSTSGSNANFGTNLGLESVFSLSSSTSSASDRGVSGTASSSTQELNSESSIVEKKHFVFASEALALYVKCLRMIQHALLYLRRSNKSMSSPPVAWTEPSRKLAMAVLVEQLNLFLDRAEQCKRRMAAYTTTHSNGRDDIHALVSTQDELLYSHAIRLGKEGAIKEVLGQTRAASELYLQAMLLLESLLTEASPSVVPSTVAAAPAPTPLSLSVDDQKRVAQFLKAMEQRLKAVKPSAEDAHSSSRTHSSAIGLAQTAMAENARVLLTMSPP